MREGEEFVVYDAITTEFVPLALRIPVKVIAQVLADDPSPENE